MNCARDEQVVVRSRTKSHTPTLWRGAVVGAILTVLCAFTAVSTSAAASQNAAIEVRSTCAPGTGCTVFVVTVTNSGTATLNGLSVEVLGGAVSALQLNGYRTTLCEQNSARSAFVCFPFSLAPGATLQGSGITTAVLTSATDFRFYTTDNGFATSTGQTIPLASSPGDLLTTPAVVGTSSPSEARLLLGVGVAILIIGAGGIGVIALGRRRRRPAKCAAERESLKNADTALRYWETAVEAVKREVESSPDDAQLGEKLMKAREGHDIALRLRDQCQLDVMQCMTSN